jgi:hypothetical protein
LYTTTIRLIISKRREEEEKNMCNAIDKYVYVYV